LFHVNVQAILTYRFPNQSVVSLKGVFKELSNPAEFEGFILTNFEGDKSYGFFEGNDDEVLMETVQPIVISEQAYIQLAHEFIHYLQDHSIGKAILSRIKKVASSLPISELFDRLTERYPNALCYAFQSPSLGTWFGATPETLVKIEGNSGSTMSLAGTKPSYDNTSWGAKEQDEQQMVTDFINENLLKICFDVKIGERTELVAGPVKHLVHHFHFSVDELKQWELIRLLHPTPAVSGFPREQALQCIYNFEPHSRSFYAGIIGVKSKELTHLYVNLRCGQQLAENVYLYVGGGLTQASVPEYEWEETENKAKTIELSL
jgi:isochorismate synthase